MPAEPNYVERIEEPMVFAFVISLNEHIGDITRKRKSLEKQKEDKSA